jgi:enoyl-CoA hydratase/3-hydroxypropionyl-coenzyme A dehydratase
MTCRELGPQEAKAAGFLNRVVPDADLDEAVASLVANLLRMPRLVLVGPPLVARWR